MSMPEESTRRERGQAVGGTLGAWAVILLLTVLAISAQMAQPRLEVEGGKLQRAALRFQSLYLVGAASLFDDQTAQPVQRQLEAWQPETAGQQVRVAVVAGELIGPEAALERLRTVPGEAESAEPSPGIPRMREVLLRLYDDYAADRLNAPSVDDAERRQLRERLGWFGDLALAPPESDTPLRRQVVAGARRTFYAVLAVVVALVTLGLLGAVLLIVYASFLFAGKLPGLPPVGRRGGVYAETFACWLVLFLGLSVAGRVLFGPEAVTAAAFLSMLGSLAALGWPLMRGIRWEQLRRDLGWTLGRRPAVEVIAGLGGYAMALPLVVLGLTLTAVAVGFTDQDMPSGAPPSHPAAQWLAEGGWWQRAQLFLLACVIAPIVEETAFRGLLYRHLRETMGRMRHGASVLLSAVASGLLFALLHPQGILAVPALTGIALALAFMREWRETLVPSIVAHGLNNAVVMTVLLALLNE